MVMAAPSGWPWGFVGRWFTTSSRFPREDLVGGLPAGPQKAGQLLVEVGQLPDVPSLRVGRKPEQPLRLVVREQQAAVPVGDQDALPDGVQDGVVVFVHTGHLEGAEPVGLPPQAPGDQGRAGRGQGQGGRADTEDDRELPLHHAGDVPHGEAGRDQCHHLAVVGGHRDDGLDLLAERPVHALGVDPAGQGRLDGADEALAD